MIDVKFFLCQIFVFQTASPSPCITCGPFYLQLSYYRTREKCLEVVDFLNHETKTEKEKQVGLGRKDVSLWIVSADGGWRWWW
jgi:hypothetical protein